MSDQPYQDVMRLLAQDAHGELEALTKALFNGSITAEQWGLSVTSTLKDLHISNAVVGAGGVDNLDFTSYGRIGGNLADEYSHLHDLLQGVADGDVSEAQAIARLNQYAKASEQAFWNERKDLMEQQASWASLPLLTQSPRDGRTTCFGNCNCQLRETPDGVYWDLYPGESCPDCQSLAAGGPYRVR